MSDIKERLRDWHPEDELQPVALRQMKEAANHIETLETEIAELKKANQELDYACSSLNGDLKVCEEWGEGCEEKLKLLKEDQGSNVFLSQEAYDALLHNSIEGAKALSLQGKLLNILQNNGNADKEIIRYFTKIDKS